MKYKHFMRPKKCVELLDIDEQGDVYCPECGRHIGFVYRIHPLKVFIFQKYVRHRQQIIENLHRIAQYPDVFGRIDPRFLEANDAAVENTIDFLSSAFDENIVCAEDVEYKGDDEFVEDDFETVAVDYPEEEEIKDCE